MAVKEKCRYFWFGYCVPYIFLAMNEDAVRGTLWFYLITIAVFSLLTAAAVKCRGITALICGNAVSCLLSLALAALTMLVTWFSAPFLIRLIIGPAETEMLSMGVRALRWSILFLPALHLLFIFRPAIQ